MPGKDEGCPVHFKIASATPPETASSSARPQTIYERLSTPKSKDRRWIPDRPSVYWLDYLIDETPHKLKTPEALNSYYNNFIPKFPRMRMLATPRSADDLASRDDEISRNHSPNTGIPLTALSYTPSERIIQLARPKTTNPKEILGRAESRSKTAKRLRTGDADTTRTDVPLDPSVDFARGDYSSRSRHRMATTPKENPINLPQIAPTKYSSKSTPNLMNSRDSRDVLAEKTKFPNILSASNVPRQLKTGNRPADPSKGDVLAKGDFVSKSPSRTKSTTTEAASRRATRPSLPGQNRKVARVSSKSSPHKELDSNNNAVKPGESKKGFGKPAAPSK